MLVYRIEGIIGESLCTDENDRNAVAEMKHKYANRSEVFNNRLDKRVYIYCEYFGRNYYARACLKKAFCKMCVTICGRFCPDEGVVAGYDNRIRVKSPAKWGVQIAGMIFQTRSRGSCAELAGSISYCRFLYSAYGNTNDRYCYIRNNFK